MNNDNNNENKVVYLHLDDILPNRFQPREVFDETGLEELAESIKEHGVIQPVIVRQMGDKYELIAGERRSKASAIAGLTKIPAIIRNMDDRESAKVSLLENLQRKNLSAIEEARTYKKILELDNMTQDDLAKTMGKSQPLIANKLRLLMLPEEVQDALIKNQISERHARSLLNLNDKKDQLMLLDRIRSERLTVRELDMEIRKMNEEVPSSNTESDDSRIAYNNFNQSPIPAYGDNTRTNFGNMGLNDYQTSVNSNMFNNIPSNYQTNDYDNNFNNNPFNLDNNIPSNNNSIDYNNYDSQEMSFNNNFSSNQLDRNNEEYSNQFQQINQNQSLGSMFDGNNLNNQEFNNNTSEEFENNSNLFMSQIKQDDMKPQENQFLPNFDTNFNSDFNTQLNDNQSSFNGEYNNSFNNFMPNQGFTDNNQLKNDLKEPIKDINDYTANQGGLFNQPLNIVDVPKTDYYQPEINAVDNYNETSLENSSLEEKEPFDNPFDDPYENILFAKPVAVSFDENEPSEDVEVIDNSDSNLDNQEEVEENKYISLEPKKTIFDVNGAVLELKKTTDAIKLNNINIDTEEIDFDDYYQIVIKIKKN